MSQDTAFSKARDEAALQQGNNHANPVIRSMYPMRSRGEMSKEFAQLFAIGADFGRQWERTHGTQKLMEAMEKAADMISSEYCSHPKECNADNARCYAQFVLQALREWKGEG